MPYVLPLMCSIVEYPEIGHDRRMSRRSGAALAELAASLGILIPVDAVRSLHDLGLAIGFPFGGALVGLGPLFPRQLAVARAHGGIPVRLGRADVAAHPVRST